MAIEYDICEKRSGGSYRSQGSYGEGGRRLATQTMTRVFRVIAYDNANPNLGPEDVSEHVVGCIPGLPRIMSSVYVDDSGLINPYAIAMSKSVQRNASNGLLFDVTVSYQTRSLEVEGCLVSPPNSPADLSPEVTASVASTQRVLYTDYSGDQCNRFAGVNFPFPEPVVTDIPTLVLTISQYENAVSYSEILERSFVTNDAPYSGFAAGLWRCVVRNVSDVDIETTIGTQTWARVTYEVALSQDGYYDQNIQFVNTGWKAQVPLVSPVYKDETKGVIQFESADSSEPETGFILPRSEGADAGKKDPNQIRPQFETFDKYRPTSFSFLQA
jgi:hypothetical protein